MRSPRSLDSPVIHQLMEVCDGQHEQTFQVTALDVADTSYLGGPVGPRPCDGFVLARSECHWSGAVNFGRLPTCCAKDA